MQAIIESWHGVHAAKRASVENPEGQESHRERCLDPVRQTRVDCDARDREQKDEQRGATAEQCEHRERLHREFAGLGASASFSEGHIALVQTEPLLTIRVVDVPLLRRAQHFVRQHSRLEPAGGHWVVRVAVRVVA
jgi:hypothetical protein